MSERQLSKTKEPRSREHAASVRTCVACRLKETPAQAADLVRWVRTPDAQVYPDLSGRSFGRGAWLHVRPNCLKKLPQILAGSFKAPVKTTHEEALALLASAGRLRVSQLLGTARRQGHLVQGATLSGEAVEAGRARLVLLAEDAEAAARLPWIPTMVSAGKVRVWGKKADLGQLFGRPETAVLVVLDQHLASGLFVAIAMALLAPLAIAAAPVNVSGNEVPTEDE